MSLIQRSQVPSTLVADGARMGRAGFVSRRVLPNQQDAALEMSSGCNLPLLALERTRKIGFSRKGFTPGYGQVLDPANRLRPGRPPRSNKLVV